jgi:hypothetical protein
MNQQPADQHNRPRAISESFTSPVTPPDWPFLRECVEISSRDIVSDRR